MNSSAGVKAKRGYNGAGRQEKARQTRRRIVEAAKELFLERGYVATSVEAIAARAGVAPETIYLHFGNKLKLLQNLLDIALVGDDRPVALLERDWMRAVLRKPDARGRVRALARETRRILERIGPVHAVLRGAALVEPRAAELARLHARRRLAGQATLVNWIAEDSALRAGLERSAAVEAYFALTSPELHHLLTVELGWSGPRYERWLAGSLIAQLLDRAH